MNKNAIITAIVTGQSARNDRNEGLRRLAAVVPFVESTWLLMSREEEDSSLSDKEGRSTFCPLIFYTAKSFVTKKKDRVSVEYVREGGLAEIGPQFSDLTSTGGVVAILSDATPAVSHLLCVVDRLEVFVRALRVNENAYIPYARDTSSFSAAFSSAVGQAQTSWEMANHWCESLTHDLFLFVEERVEECKYNREFSVTEGASDWDDDGNQADPCELFGIVVQSK